MVACFSYLSSCSYLGFAVNTSLYPMYLVTPYFQVYPAMSAAYVSINDLVQFSELLMHTYFVYRNKSCFSLCR